jgi:L-rhamnose isomerase
MATVIDEKVKGIINEHGWLKVVLSVLFSGLAFGKGRGWFNKGAGPAVLLAVALSSGCALNAEIRYPWDKQKDKQEVVAKNEVKAVVLEKVESNGSFDPTPSSSQIAMAKKGKK